ncbi:MAG: glutathione S-transferase family protein [Novosphingobium sp.]|nr:glutathione S-transferase family protein [Novosphingobium sp.]
MTDAPSGERLVLHGMSSPNVTKVVLMLEECGLDYELRHVAVFNQEQFTPEFLALNPLAKVPVLEDPLLPGQPLAESGAILFWLAEREGKFLPSAAGPRAETMQWVMHQMANYGPMLGQLNHFTMALQAGSEPYATARYRAQAERLYRLLDDRLASREWLAGGAYSIADMAMHPWAFYLEQHQFDPADHPAMVAWRTRIAERPAVQRAQARIAEAFHAKIGASMEKASREDYERFYGIDEGMPPAKLARVPD